MTAVSLTVDWDRGWDGGSTQTFHLSYGNKEQLLSDNPNGNEHYTVTLGEADGIEESTQYTVSLYASNSEGSSTAVTDVATTKGKCKQTLPMIRVVYTPSLTCDILQS